MSVDGNRVQSRGPIVYGTPLHELTYWAQYCDTVEAMEVSPGQQSDVKNLDRLKFAIVPSDEQTFSTP